MAFLNLEHYAEQLKLYSAPPPGQQKHVATIYLSIRSKDPKADTHYVSNTTPTAKTYLAVTPDQIGSEALADRIVTAAAKCAFKCPPCEIMVQNKVPCGLTKAQYGCPHICRTGCVSRPPQLLEDGHALPLHHHPQQLV